MKIPASNWKNDNNQEGFYNCEPAEKILRQYAERGGLESGCDVRYIYSKLNNTSILLDVGSGYGRVINALINQGYKGKIESIEKSNTLYQHLVQQFSSPQIHLNCIDIFDFNSEIKYDAILSLWSVISDFSPQEQPLFIKKLADLLKDNGSIFLDTLTSHQAPLNAKSAFEQNYILSDQGCTLHGYSPLESDIQNYAEQAGLTQVESHEYFTDTQRSRTMYILKK